MPFFTAGINFSPLAVSGAFLDTSLRVQNFLLGKFFFNEARKTKVESHGKTSSLIELLRNHFQIVRDVMN